MRWVLALRREDKNEWERRAPLVPDDIRWLREEHHIEAIVQPSLIRAFTDDEYRQAGAQIEEDLSEAHALFAVKEIPPSLLLGHRINVFFSHTVKGQAYNMPLLRAVLDKGCTLIDYERIVAPDGRRIIYFGNYAGLAGMIDALWALGRRLAWEGMPTPLMRVKQALEYASLDQAKEEIAEVGHELGRQGVPEALQPLVVAIAGYGNVSQGAQEILDLLPHKDVRPSDLATLPPREPSLMKVVFTEEDMMERLSGEPFDLQDYYNHPEGYGSRFASHLPHLTVLMNCIYWESRYPRLVTKDGLAALWQGPKPRLRVIGDITCDVQGAIECTERTTTPGDPIFVFNPFTSEVSPGHEGVGPVILAVDNLPCELPRESSSFFSRTLRRFVPPLVKTDLAYDFHQTDLPPALKEAAIVWKGQLTPAYRYLSKHLSP